MTDFCRWIGGFCLVIGSAGLVLKQLDYAIAGALLSVAWYLAGQVAAAIDAEKRRRDQ